MGAGQSKVEPYLSDSEVEQIADALLEFPISPLLTPAKSEYIKRIADVGAAVGVRVVMSRSGL